MFDSLVITRLLPGHLPKFRSRVEVIGLGFEQVFEKDASFIKAVELAQTPSNFNRQPFVV